MLELVRSLLAWPFLIIAIPFVLYLTLLTLGALLPLSVRRPGSPPRPIAILIPAHNESLLIADTVKAALQQDYPADQFIVQVIADNCSDDTAERARSAGARVYERSGNPGKGQALHDTLQRLLEEKWEAFLIMDADSRLTNNALQTINDLMADGAKVVQLRYGVLNPNESIRTLAMEMGTASYNGIRPRGRTTLGLSCGIFGNGFCPSREAITQVPYLAHSIVEDLEYHLLLLKSGIKVHYSDQAWVDAQMPVTASDSQSQRVRWERGRIEMIKMFAPDLLKRSLKGDGMAFEGLIDVIIPPASVIVLASIIPLIIGNDLERCIAAILVGLLFVHYLSASLRYGSLYGLLRLSTYLPWYIFWKTAVIVSSLLKDKHLPWVRTERHEHSEQDGDKK